MITMSKCPRCGSKKIRCIGYHSYAIAIDDAVEVDLYECRSCGNEWEV